MKVPGEAIPNAQNGVEGFVFFHRLWSVGDQASQNQSSKSGTVCCCAGKWDWLCKSRGVVNKTVFIFVVLQLVESFSGTHSSEHQCWTVVAMGKVENLRNQKKSKMQRFAPSPFLIALLIWEQYYNILFKRQKEKKMELFTILPLSGPNLFFRRQIWKKKKIEEI